MSTSRYHGVYPSGARWVARTQIRNKITHVGVYDREVDAALAYDIVVYGEFFINGTFLRPTNFGMPNGFLLDEYTFKRKRGCKICRSVPALRFMKYEPSLDDRKEKYIYQTRGKRWYFYTSIGFKINGETLNGT